MNSFLIFCAYLVAFMVALYAYFYIRYYAESKHHSWLSALILLICAPVSFLSYVKDEGMITHRWIRIPLMLLSPCFLIPLFIVVGVVLIIIGMSTVNTGVPTGTDYHTAYDLQKATGVEFPDVTPVDSSYFDSYGHRYICVKFVPKEPLSEDFFRNLDKACEEDSICWARNDSEYVYTIYPVENLDRTKKDVIPYRIFEDDDTNNSGVTLDWQGTYITVTVPFKGDTITVENGWAL